MEPWSNSDDSSESEYESDKESTLIRDCEEDDAADALEPCWMEARQETNSICYEL